MNDGRVAPAGAAVRYDSAVRHVGTAVAFAMSAYHLYTGFAGAPIGEVHYPLHLLFAFAVLFLAPRSAAPGGWRGVLARGYDLLVLGLTIASTAYLFLNAEHITTRMLLVDPLTTTETVLGLAMAFVVLEAGRRAVGTALVILLVSFMLYAHFGHLLPPPLWHRGYPVDAIIEYSYLTTEGVFGVPVAVMAQYVFHFVLFGALLVASGAGTFFTDFARALTGRATGGPAKTAVISSALMGMLSGSSAANVVTTGSFTIPAMRRAGYPPTFAAGVEAVASSGGQITPPIMGAAAFIMVEFVGVPYADIMVAAAIPAFLYFLAVFIMVDLEARRLGLRGIAGDRAPPLVQVLRHRGYLLLSIVAMIWLLVDGWTPTTAAVWAIATLVVLLLLFDPENRRRILRVAWQAMTEAPGMVAPVTVACAVGGILIGIIGQTGLGLRMSAIILDFSGGHLLAILVLTTIMGIVLGMGMPTSGAYIIMAALLAPGLVDAGIALIAAHMFIMFVASKSSITPPVAIASYAAAALAGTDPWKTSIVAFRLGLSVFIIPYMFVYGPQLLAIGAPLEIAWSLVTASIGIGALSVAMIGWLGRPLGILERTGHFAASLLLIKPGLATDAIGLGLFGALCCLALYRRRQAGPGAVPIPSGDQVP
ncbi:MAG: TRAP transporter permease [Alphaproteobacteria bacterium]